MLHETFIIGCIIYTYMTKLKEAFFILIAIILILVGGLYILTYSNQKTSHDTIALGLIRDIIINGHNCPVALPKLADLIKSDSTYADAWQWQGVCQFQRGDMVSAKTSFQKALALDSKDAAAQNYLNIIASSTPTKVNVSAQKDFETKLRFTPDPSFLSLQNISPTQSFKTATATSATVEIDTAVYVSKKPFTEVQDYLTKALQGIAAATFKTVQSSTNTLFNVVLVPGKQTYIISVSKSSPVQISIIYTNKQ